MIWVTITPRTNDRNVIGTFLAAKGEADYFDVSVYTVCETCGDVHILDNINSLPCERSAVYLAERFCVVHNIDEYNLDYRVDTPSDLSDMPGVKASHVAH
jgi:hypothetical protein